jgi:hypothetical protein
MDGLVSAKSQERTNANPKSTISRPSGFGGHYQ